METTYSFLIYKKEQSKFDAEIKEFTYRARFGQIIQGLLCRKLIEEGYFVLKCNITTKVVQ